MTSDTPDLPQTQFHPAGQAVPHGLPELMIGCESRTVLGRADVLQQSFPRGWTDLPSTTRSRGHTSGGGADRPYTALCQSGISAGVPALQRIFQLLMPPVFILLGGMLIMINCSLFWQAALLPAIVSLVTSFLNTKVDPEYFKYNCVKSNNHMEESYGLGRRWDWP